MTHRDDKRSDLDTEWEPHALSPGVLLATGVALLILTAITVYAAQVDLGRLNIVVALGIASIKASLVGLFFMHLKYDDRFNSVVLVSALFFAVFLIGFVIFDSTQYQPSIDAKQQTEQSKVE